ncbi:MAG: class I SAM-dependent methyltransferase [Pseudomonadota bacterium]
MADRVGMALDFGAQAVRFGWFLGVIRIVDRQTTRLGADRNFKPTRPVPNQREMLADLRQLIAADAEAVGRGVIPPQELAPRGLPDHVGRLRAMLRDLPSALKRRADKDASTVKAVAEDQLGELPDYFTQDFHFQTGGYLSEESAKLYDVQVETLFYGSAQLMRRVGLMEIAKAAQGRDQRTLSLVDIACGTGRLLRDVRRAFPAMRLTGLDLSEAYLNESSDHMTGLRPATFMQANAEDVPLEADSQDIVSSVILFHELPADVRRTVAAEFARVLKPGGTLVFIDSLQMGDRPGWDGLLEAFPVRFHEPYYRQYTIDPLDKIFEDAGLTVTNQQNAFLSKVVTCVKP